MSPRPGIVLCLLGAAALLLLALQGRGLAEAAARRERAEALLASTAGLLRERAQLESARETASAGRRPDQDVIARVNATLARAGLDPRAFRGQHPEADARLPRAGAQDHMEYRRQSVRLSLAALTPAQLGRFLRAWREEHPMWTPTRIDLLRRQGEGAADDPPGTYDVAVVVSAIYVEAAPGGGAGS